MKKLLCIFLALIVLGGCKEVEVTETKSEAYMFKEEYESLNGLQDIKYPDNTYRVVNIDEDNPYVLTTADELVKMIEDKETFYVYFGDPMCPWCRSNIEAAIAQAKQEGISKIYYIHMWDENRNEIVRDKYESIDGEVVKTFKGQDAYFKLLDSLDLYLDNYLVQNGDEQYDTGEKRIVMPSYVHFLMGEVDKYSEGTSGNQNDSHQELSEEILKDQEMEFDSFFSTNKACSLNNKGC